MRLRFIHLPDYGPLNDIGIVFGQNELIENRKGAINFVVGLNGSGKSNLLRAIFDVFRSLYRQEVPHFQVTLVYELDKQEAGRHTVVIHRPHGPASACFIGRVKKLPVFKQDTEWQDWVEQLQGNNESDFEVFIPGDQLKGHGELNNLLPSNVVAYTSGDKALWEAIDYPQFPADELDVGNDAFDFSAERPTAWTAERERTLNPGNSENQRIIQQENEFKSSGGFNRKCILFANDDLFLGACALGIWQAALELGNHTDDELLKARNELLNQVDNSIPGKDARRIFNELDWLRPTHVGLVLDEQLLRQNTLHHTPLYWMFSLTSNIIRYPMGDTYAVINLGRRPSVRPDELRPADQVDNLVLMVGESMRNANSGAEALCKIMSGGADIEDSLWFVFETLRELRDCGILKDIKMSVMRVREQFDAESRLDDTIHSYSGFSDGERMLLGRMALLHLLDGRSNSLLLLDEPETHFNDTWKRQIIDYVDDIILKSTSAQVVVATHTSLALTDVFSCEITKLVKVKGFLFARPVLHPTFGADPGRLLLHVFGAPDTIGARAAEFLRSKLDPAKWPPEDREKLKSLIDETGSGWPRAKLMEILDKLEQEDAAPHS